ncbi:MAG: hypothetical protein FJW20_04470 [Acidimicrobiia bacterium]|nr:hypothetical protein [Acidimicrobiia bacterium]
MQRHIEDRLEEYLSGTLDADRRAEFERNLEAAGEYTADMVAQFEQHGRLLRDTFHTPSAMEPAPGFYARVMQRVDAQRANPWWFAFLEPQFTARIAMASTVLLVLIGLTYYSTEAGRPTGTLTAVEVMAEPPSDSWVAEDPQPAQRNVILVDLATYQD